MACGLIKFSEIASNLRSGKTMRLKKSHENFPKLKGYLSEFENDLKLKTWNKGRWVYMKKE